MSASGFSIFKAGNSIHMVLASDGLAYSLDEAHEVRSTSYRKIWKLRGSTGLSWLGAMAKPIDAVITQLVGLDAETAIHKAAGILEENFSSLRDKEILAEKPFSLNTFEVTEKGVEYWRCFYYEDKFTPCKRGTIPPGKSGAMLYDSPDGLSFTPYIQEAKKVVNEMNMKDVDVALRTLVGTAFEAMVNEYSEKGYPVGGQIFTETIKKP